ncbi:MAG: hemolysin III family protein [Ruminococcaceae bacterium]|nr:hemolysin III family protein [Oscillospiraceae bacterium]
MLAFKINFNGQTLGEEIANSVSHGIGALLAIAGTAVMVVTACLTSDVMGIVSAALYGFFTILLYMFSTIYHSLTNTKAKRVFQIFDHCSIFLMILGSYIPICLCLIRGLWGWVLFSITAVLAIFGIVFNSIDLKRWHKMSMILYVLMGWSLIFMFKHVVEKVPIQGILLLVGGGVFYTLGIIFFAKDKVRYMHYIWHIFVLLGTITQYFFILFYVIPL